MKRRDIATLKRIRRVEPREQISKLRRKLEEGGEPRILHTIRGAGYVLRAA